MSDIVERLRQRFESGCDADNAILCDAADEIERLRAVIVALRTDCDCEPAHEAARRALEEPQSSAASNACEQDEGA